MMKKDSLSERKTVSYGACAERNSARWQWDLLCDPGAAKLSRTDMAYAGSGLPDGDFASALRKMSSFLSRLQAPPKTVVEKRPSFNLDRAIGNAVDFSGEAAKAYRNFKNGNTWFFKPDVPTSVRDDVNNVIYSFANAPKHLIVSQEKKKITEAGGTLSAVVGIVASVSVRRGDGVDCVSVARFLRQKGIIPFKVCKTKIYFAFSDLDENGKDIVKRLIEFKNLHDSNIWT